MNLGQCANVITCDSMVDVISWNNVDVITCDRSLGQCVDVITCDSMVDVIS